MGDAGELISLVIGHHTLRTITAVDLGTITDFIVFKAGDATVYCCKVFLRSIMTITSSLINKISILYYSNIYCPFLISCRKNQE